MVKYPVNDDHTRLTYLFRRNSLWSNDWLRSDVSERKTKNVPAMAAKTHIANREKADNMLAERIISSL